MGHEESGVSRFVEMSGAGEDEIFESGPMSGFRVVHQENGVSFLKGGNFLCAAPGRRKLVADRKIAASWEVFSLIPQEDLESALVLTKPTSHQIVRFNKRVIGLMAEHKPIKIYSGCGGIPRLGFINVDGNYSPPVRVSQGA
jgi:hypothetical protein